MQLNYTWGMIRMTRQTQCWGSNSKTCFFPDSLIMYVYYDKIERAIIKTITYLSLLLSSAFSLSDLA